MLWTTISIIFTPFHLTPPTPLCDRIVDQWSLLSMIRWFERRADCPNLIHWLFLSLNWFYHNWCISKIRVPKTKQNKWMYKRYFLFPGRTSVIKDSFFLILFSWRTMHSRHCNYDWDYVALSLTCCYIQLKYLERKCMNQVNQSHSK